jgi:hypothetical protein
MGAIVRYCGHQATFVADIFEIDGVNVVRASCGIGNSDRFMNQLSRDASAYYSATHQLTDFPRSGFWRPDLGVFVVPGSQVTEVKAKKNFPEEPRLKR